MGHQLKPGLFGQVLTKAFENKLGGIFMLAANYETWLCGIERLIKKL